MQCHWDNDGRAKWAGRAACLGNIRIACNILVGKPERRGHAGEFCQDRIMMFKWVLNAPWFPGLEQKTLARNCGNTTEPSSNKKSYEFIHSKRVVSTSGGFCVLVLGS